MVIFNWLNERLLTLVVTINSKESLQKIDIRYQTKLLLLGVR